MVADELAATAGEDGRTAGETCVSLRKPLYMARRSTWRKRRASRLLGIPSVPGDDRSLAEALLLEHQQGIEGAVLEVAFPQRLFLFLIAGAHATSGAILSAGDS